MTIPTSYDEQPYFSVSFFSTNTSESLSRKVAEFPFSYTLNAATSPLHKNIPIYNKHFMYALHKRRSVLEFWRRRCLAWYGEKKRMAWEQLEETQRQTFRRLFEFKIPLLSNLKFQSACLLAGCISWVNSYLLWKAAPTIPCRNSLRFFRSTCFSVKLQKKRQEWIFRVWIYECVLGVCVYNNRRLCLNAALKSGRDPQYLKKSNENLRVVLIGYSLRLYFYEDDFLFV